MGAGRERRGRMRRGTLRRRNISRRVEALGEPSGGPPGAPDDMASPVAPDARAPSDDLPGTAPVAAASSWRRWFGWLRSPTAQRAHAAALAPSEDPARLVLAIPRGVGRLDAFVEVLDTLVEGSPDHRSVTLAFHRELVTLSERAHMDLRLYPARVARCAKALHALGEAEKAAELLAEIGERERAADLFLEAGAIEALEAMHAALEEREAGPKLSARLSYERFSARFALGQRRAAWQALREAVALWPENTLYGELLARFEAQVCRGALVLAVTGGDRKSKTYVISGSWPAILGRGEEALLRLASPRVSREHVAFERVEGAILAFDRVGRGDVTVDGQMGPGPFPLAGEGRVHVGPWVVSYALDAQVLALESAQGPDACLLLCRDAEARIPLHRAEGRFLPLRVEDDGTFSIVGPHALTLAGEPLEVPHLLMVGDVLEGPGYVCRVVAHRR